jgi:NADPH:quinone reductase-like Zn-dependent oxidoreductase
MSPMVRATAFGSADVLIVASTPIPDVEAGHVVVQVKAAGVNPIDWKLYGAAFRAAHRSREDTADVPTDPLPGVGLECAGVVVAVGTDAFNVKIGDEVIVHPVVGAYADYVHAPITSLTIKPRALDWPQAAALMLAGTTAAHALDAAGVQAGDTVLIHGGSGGVGLMAVQLAVDLGAAVIATAARANHNLLTQLGARAVTYGCSSRGHARKPPWQIGHCSVAPAFSSEWDRRSTGDCQNLPIPHSELT